MSYTTKKIILLGVAVLITNSSIAQKKLKQDSEAIKQMCGCFEVTFNFSETFEYSQDSLYRASKQKTESALEWAGLIKDEKGNISIQHILQVGGGEHVHIVKHWRQDWIYENTGFYMYNANNKWNYETKSAGDMKGQWTQKVYQVDDSPRYEGSATWVHVDGKSFWENTTDAPLPRREYTTRSDYNITERGNRHEIVDNGWVHDQDNSKVIREEGKEDVILAKEKGYNTYVRQPDSKCQAAIDWWNEHQDKWAIVRSKWDNVYGMNQNLTLKEKVENKALFKHLFNDECTKREQIDGIIDSFVVK